MYLAKELIKELSDNLSCKGIYSKFIWNQFNTFISLNQPSIIKIIGYSPIKFKNKSGSIIVQEYASNKALDNILEIEIENKSKKLINDTQRLIILYGIASAIHYLHSHNYIHTNLQPSEVFLDDFLFPKIEGFRHYAKASYNPIPDLSLCSKRNFYSEINIYKSPEQLFYYGVSTVVDVYAFAMIAYQLITNERNLLIITLMQRNTKIILILLINHNPQLIIGKLMIILTHKINYFKKFKLIFKKYENQIQIFMWKLDQLIYKIIKSKK